VLFTKIVFKKYKRKICYMLCSRLCSRNPHCTPPTSVFLIISIVVYIFPLATHTNFIVLQGATKRFQF